MTHFPQTWTIYFNYVSRLLMTDENDFMIANDTKYILKNGLANLHLYLC